MKSRATFLGHPVHPMLITFPVGLLVTAVIFEIIGLISGKTMWTEVAFYMIAAGFISGLLAAVFGFIDYMAIPSGTRAKSIAMMHGAGNVTMVVLFGIAWLLWQSSPRHVGVAPAILTFIGVAIIGFTGWLGGELVDRLGVGVEPGANLNAPNSLSGVAVDTELPVRQRRRA